VRVTLSAHAGALKAEKRERETRESFALK